MRGLPLGQVSLRMPHAPGHGASLRASGTTQHSVALRASGTASEAPQRCPGAEDPPSEASEVFAGALPARRPVRGADK